MKNRTDLFTNALIWFGVAISVSEIEAGVQIGAQSTLNSLWLPLIAGHILGGALLFFVGLIGARVRLNAMQTITSTFGEYGSKFFAILNVLQLLAWVAVLNAQGASALIELNLPISFPLICLILALFIAIWVYIGLQRSSKITKVIMIILTILLIILSAKLLELHMPAASAIRNSQALTFWNIFEISIAMPISWLPVISDYTKDAEKPVKASLVSAIGYTIASLWMYFIGVGISGIGTTSISHAILLSGLGISGIIILALSTVTTNFLATNSAGESAKAIFNKINPKIAGVIVSFLSALLAISGIMNHYIDFLYLISSVFGPMASVLLVSSYIVKEDNMDAKSWYWNIFAWFVGFIVYQAAANFDSIILGPTLLSLVASAAVAYLRVLIKKV